jgi:hypothetical protein
VPVDAADDCGDNRMIETPAIAIVPIGVSPPNVLAGFAQRDSRIGQENGLRPTMTVD